MSEISGPGEQAKPLAGRRVYPPHEVQGRLGVSASGLRRLAGIYERTVGALPRDDRGRVWPEEAVEALEDARALVREQRAVSIEAALRGQTLEPGDDPRPARGFALFQNPTHPGADVGAAILEELRALRELAEEQNRRIAELEKAVRTGRELPTGQGPARDPGASLGESTEAQDGPEGPAEGYGPGDPLGGTETTIQREGPWRGPWRRVLAWFGFGER